MYEVKDGETVENREANELACDLMANGARELKKKIPHAAATLEAIERAIEYVRNSMLDGANRDILLSVRPGEARIAVTSVIVIPPLEPFQ